MDCLCPTINLNGASIVLLLFETYIHIPLLLSFLLDLFVQSFPRTAMLYEWKIFLIKNELKELLDLGFILQANDKSGRLLWSTGGSYPTVAPFFLRNHLPFHCHGLIFPICIGRKINTSLPKNHIPTFRYSTKLCRIFQSVTVLLWRIGKSVTVCLSWKSCGVNEMEMLSNSLFKKSSMRGSWTPARRTGRKHATISPQSQLVISPRKRGYIYFVATFASHIYYPLKHRICVLFCKSATCPMTEKKAMKKFEANIERK